MKQVTGAVLGMALAALCGTARAADLSFSLTGERSSDGALQASFYGLSDAGLSQPTSIAFTFTPYYGSDQTPLSGTVSGADASMTGGFDIEGGALAPSTFSFSIPDANLSIDTGAGSFTGSFFGDDTFYKPGDGVFNGGGMSYALTPSAAPEIQTWALMITGAGLAGMALRRRVAIV
jgi:hypothetical protein